MEYLRSQFHEYLNEEGAVDIVGYPFLRDRILIELDNEAYKEAFNGWLQQRKEANLERAAKILEKQINPPGRFPRLQAIYKNDNIIPFIGAGMSMPSGYLGWTNFLYSVLEHSNTDKSAFEALINAGQYEDAAEMLCQNLHNDGFLEHVENEFKPDKELCGVIQRLPFLFKKCAITTNFDSVVARCYSSAEQPFVETLLGADAANFPRLMTSNKKILIKLHGNADSSQNRVLTKSEYDRHYTGQTTLESVIEAISYQTLLFVGCSLSVDRTIKCLSSIVQRKGSENMPRHYAFLEQKDGEDVRIRQGQLLEANIFPIWYSESEGTHDECIEALLEKLAEGDS